MEKNTKAFYAGTFCEGSDTQCWVLERNGFGSCSDFAANLFDRKRILDAGCGSGRGAALLREQAPTQAEIAGIDLVAEDVAHENFKGV